MQDLFFEELYSTTKEISQKLDRIEDRQIRMEETIKIHDRDLNYLNLLVWKGGENPPLTERLAVLDNSIEESSQRLTADIQRLEQSINNKNQMVWSLVIGTLSLLFGSFITSIDFYPSKNPTELLKSGEGKVRTTTSTKEEIEVIEP